MRFQLLYYYFINVLYLSIQLYMHSWKCVPINLLSNKNLRQSDWHIHTCRPTSTCGSRGPVARALNKLEIERRTDFSQPKPAV